MDSFPLFLDLFQHQRLEILLLTFPLALFIVPRNEVFVEVASSALAGQVGVVGRWHQADCLCRTNVLITEVMGTLLHHVGIELVLVIDDDVVSRANLPLEAGVRLKVEVEQEGR